MTDANPQPKPNEISLDEIDKILEQDDPEFSKGLNEIQQVGAASDVVIESEVAGEESLSTEEAAQQKSWWEKNRLLAKLVPALFARWLKIRARLWLWAKQAWHFLRTSPIEFGKYLRSQLVVIFKKLRAKLTQLKELPLPKKIALLAFVTLFGITVGLAVKTVKGRWLPEIYHPELTNFATVADRVWEVSKEGESVIFLRAFPQDEFQFLFKKIIVNLKRTNSSQNPMGAFEFYAVLDSKETALEVQARQHELHDRLQRAVEGQTYAELENPMGRKHLKDVLRATLNESLTQGWAQDVLIKTYVLKP